MKKATYVFGCPVCHKQIKSDEPGEPCCTGPLETSDDHEMEVMRLLRIEQRGIGPQYAQRRAEGMLLIPGGLDGFADKAIEREVKLAIAK